MLIGNMEKLVHGPVFSPSNTRLMRTVKTGDDDLIVATNDTAMYFNAIRPSITVAHRKTPITSRSCHKRVMFVDVFELILLLRQ
jgi:hypothetical protein